MSTTKPATDAEIAELKSLLEKATQGEWVAELNSYYCDIRAEHGQIGDMCASNNYASPGIEMEGNIALSEANAKCAVAEHNLLPAILIRLETAEAERRGIHDLIFDAYQRIFGDRRDEWTDPVSAIDLMVADLKATQADRDAERKGVVIALDTVLSEPQHASIIGHPGTPLHERIQRIGQLVIERDAATKRADLIEAAFDKLTNAIVDPDGGAITTFDAIADDCVRKVGELRKERDAAIALAAELRAEAQGGKNNGSA